MGEWKKSLNDDCHMAHCNIKKNMVGCVERNHLQTRRRNCEFGSLGFRIKPP
jgi:hypothetical protein